MSRVCDNMVAEPSILVVHNRLRPSIVLVEKVSTDLHKVANGLGRLQSSMKLAFAEKVSASRDTISTSHDTVSSSHGAVMVTTCSALCFSGNLGNAHADAMSPSTLGVLVDVPAILNSSAVSSS